MSGDVGTRRRWTGALLASLAALFPLPSRAMATAATTRVSVNTDGGDVDRDSARPCMRWGIRYVAFESNGTNLVPGDTNGRRDVFVRDLTLGTTMLVSVDRHGGPTNGTSAQPCISADGRYVVFLSSASDLVPGDTNGRPDAFLRDLLTNTTVRVGSNAGPTTSELVAPSLSAAGDYVAFASEVPLAPDDTNGVEDVFVYDVAAGTTVRVSTDVSGGDPDGPSLSPSISGDGRYVAFMSLATDIVTDDGDELADLFVRDLATGSTVRATVDMNSGDPNDRVYAREALSSDGRYLVFVSEASNLVEGDQNGVEDVFVRDLYRGRTTLVSVDAGGGNANGPSGSPSIGSSGRYVAFRSTATDLVVGDGNGYSDVFLRDTFGRTTTRVSVDADGAGANMDSWNPAIGMEAGVPYVAFVSKASDLVPDDHNGLEDVFVRQLG